MSATFPINENHFAKTKKQHGKTEKKLNINIYEVGESDIDRNNVLHRWTYIVQTLSYLFSTYKCFCLYSM